MADPFSLSDFGIDLNAGGYSLGLDVEKDKDDPKTKDVPAKTDDKADDKATAGEWLEKVKPYALPVGIALVLLLGVAALSKR